ncbi:MAG: hypothetical protein AAGB10_13565 [Pseudomonadota bacterium]
MSDLKTRDQRSQTGRFTTKQKGFIYPVTGDLGFKKVETLQPIARLKREAPTGLKLALPLGGSRSGGPGGPTDKEAGHVAPNLRLLLVLYEMEHQVVANGGVPQSWVFWKGDSDVATIQTEFDLSLPLPGPGETWPIGLGSVIYEGINLNACGGGGGVSFPVSLESWVVEDTDEGGINGPFGDEYGRVTVSDDSTVDLLGTYLFNYKIRANASGGKSSDFHLRGEVWVQCVNDSTV